MSRNKPGAWRRPKQEWVLADHATMPLNARYTGDKVTLRPVRAGTLAAKVRLAAWGAAGDGKLPVDGLNIIGYDLREGGDNDE